MKNLLCVNRLGKHIAISKNKVLLDLLNLYLLLVVNSIGSHMLFTNIFMVTPSIQLKAAVNNSL